jgi:hypothetical protein
LPLIFPPSIFGILVVTVTPCPSARRHGRSLMVGFASALALAILMASDST